MMSLVLGILTAALGIYGLSSWSGDFVIFLKGLVFFGLIFAGLIAFLAGLSSFRK